MEDFPHPVYRHPDITRVAEYLEDKLYFATLSAGRREVRSSSVVHFFSVDRELVYRNFYDDFGPLNLACLYKYCCKLNRKLKDPDNKYKMIVHYTTPDPETHANSAFLVASYAILYLDKTPREAMKPLILGNAMPRKPFRDVSLGPPKHIISLLDCLKAIHKAFTFGFFRFDDFDLAEYEKYQEMRHGDLNWIVPRKFLAFIGPSDRRCSGYHTPEHYLPYFRRNGVVAVVRLSRKTYDASRFKNFGIQHYDIFLPDGSVPSPKVLNEFLHLAETTDGPIAVHCKAGLGRTGSLIAAYLVKHHRMSAREAIAWVRICRPGSVIGHQQTWLENMESALWRSGFQYRKVENESTSKRHGDGDLVLRHKRGIYSIADKFARNLRATFRNLFHNHRMATLRESPGPEETWKDDTRDSSEIKLRRRSRRNNLNFKEPFPTQGDILNRLKLDRERLQ